jgi:hypothetical protein
LGSFNGSSDSLNGCFDSLYESLDSLNVCFDTWCESMYSLQISFHSGHVYMGLFNECKVTLSVWKEAMEIK